MRVCEKLAKDNRGLRFISETYTQVKDVAIRKKSEKIADTSKK